MSLRLRLLNLGLRALVRPVLRRTRGPEAAERDFARAAALAFRAPPFLCRQTGHIGGVPVHWLRTPRVRLDRVILYLHGGAYFSGSGRTHGGLAARLGKLAGAQVCLPDYRLLQQAPFPAPVEDALAVWEGLRALGYPARGIALAGDSAGGGLALALLAELAARGEGPAALYAMSPWSDLTLSGETLGASSEALIPVERLAEVVARYLGRADPSDPRASPLYAAWTGALPPVLLQVGSGECLRADADRMAEVLRRAGAEVRLQHWPDAPHVWQIFDGWLPEARAALTEAGAFLQTSFDSASR